MLLLRIGSCKSGSFEQNRLEQSASGRSSAGTALKEDTLLSRPSKIKLSSRTPQSGSMLGHGTANCVLHPAHFICADICQFCSWSSNKACTIWQGKLHMPLPHVPSLRQVAMSWSGQSCYSGHCHCSEPTHLGYTLPRPGHAHCSLPKTQAIFKPILPAKLLLSSHPSQITKSNGLSPRLLDRANPISLE